MLTTGRAKLLGKHQVSLMCVQILRGYLNIDTHRVLFKIKMGKGLFDVLENALRMFKEILFFRNFKHLMIL